MKKKLFLLFLLFAVVVNAQIINFTDANFKAKLLSSSPSNTVAKNLAGNYFAIDANGDGEVQVSEAQQVKDLNINSSNIASLEGIVNFSSLKTLDCKYNHFTLLNLPGLTVLESLDCSENYQLTLLDVQGCTALQTLNCNNNLQLNTLNVQGCTSLQNLECSENKLTSLNLQGLINLQTLSCYGLLQLTALDVHGLNNLQNLSCSGNFTVLNVQGCTSLQNLFCGFADFTSLDLQGLTNLENVTISGTALTSLNLQGFTALQFLTLYSNSQLTFLNVQGCTALQTLDIGQNSLTSLNVQGLVNLQTLYCAYNYMTSLNVQGCTGLQNLICSGNQLTTLNVQDCINLQDLNCNYNQLTSLFLKNGQNETLSYNNNPNLTYICADNSQLANVQYLVNLYGYTCNVNSYCSFVPGGNYNTITGKVRFDENNNGCDINDEIFEHMKLKITDGNNSGETFVNSQGKYNFYTQAGSFTVTAEPENPALFQVTPSNYYTSFPNNNNNIYTKDLCVTQIGTSNDLEVVIAPLTSAVPGFNAKYKIMWRNKGNTTLSGNVAFNFDNSKMTFVSSSLPYSSASGNQIIFNFSNLKPYANKTTEIVFTINSPTHPTNPVNSGDMLNFSAVVDPVGGDINPQDNTFTYKQTVINSFDPNDIVCMEGNTIPPSMIGKYLHYIVNFENTGTAPVTNIVVEMDINPADFDINTLQLQNTSFPTYTKVGGNKVEFIMEFANMGSGGHGNVLMKIKSKNSLSMGDNVMNKANIYFDYNFPIATNEAVTNIVGVLKMDETAKDESVTIYPNPTKGEVNINSDSKIQSVEIYDIQGRIIQKQIGINSSATKINIHNSNTGIFYFKVKTDKGSILKKVIKN